MVAFRGYCWKCDMEAMYIDDTLACCGHNPKKDDKPKVFKKILIQQYKNWKNCSNKRNRTPELSLWQYYELINGKCYYCGAEPEKKLSLKKFGYVPKLNGIDRVDNKIGYRYDNCVSCCKHCNMMKRTYTLNEFLNRIKNIYEIHKLNNK